MRRISEELHAFRQREKDLRQTIEELRRQASTREPLDEATLMAALGQEAARVLQTAREAATDIRTKAEESAARLLREAEERGARVVRESEERANRLRGEAEGVLRVRTDEAEQAAASVRHDAEADAQGVRSRAEAEAAAELEKARSHGKEMVAEAQALRERVLADLIRRRGMARSQIEQLRAGRERLLEAYRVVRRTLDEATGELSTAEGEARLAAEAAARRIAATAEGTIEELETELGAARRAPLPLAEPSSPWTPRPEPATVEPVPAVGPMPKFRAPPPSPAPRTEEEEAQAPPTASPVDDLFARIRADREVAVAEASKVLDPPTQASPETEARVADNDEVLLQQRDELTEPIEQQLAKRLKRALQDEQNELLDGLRTSNGQALTGLLPDRDKHLDRYRHAATSALEEAALAGTRFAHGEGIDVGLTVEALAGELAEELIAPLRSRIEATLGEGDEAQVLAERLSATYRQSKTQQIDGLARQQVATAFSQGAYAATSEGTTLRWVVDDDGGSCPDCDDNALAGPTPKSESFPTGQLLPPAHPGCRCLLVPTG